MKPQDEDLIAKHANILNFAKENFGIDSSEELASASNLISGVLAGKTTMKVAETPIRKKTAIEPKVVKSWYVGNGHIAVIYEGGGRGDIYGKTNKDPKPRPYDPDPEINLQCAIVEAKSQIARGVNSAEECIRSVYESCGIPFVRETQPRGLGKVFEKQVKETLLSWENYEQGIKDDSLPVTWACYIDTGRNIQAAELRDAFNNEWTDEDKKTFLLHTGIPFQELLKMSLRNRHIMRMLDEAECERERRVWEAKKKKVARWLSSHNVTLCIISIVLLLTRPVCRWTMGRGEPEEIYIYIRWGVALVAIWQAVRLFRVKRAFYVAILLCASAIILNPFANVRMDKDVYAWIYAAMSIPFALVMWNEWRMTTPSGQAPMLAAPRLDQSKDETSP